MKSNGLEKKIVQFLGEQKKLNLYIEKRMHLHYDLLPKAREDHRILVEDHRMLIEWLKDHEVRLRKVER